MTTRASRQDNAAFGNTDIFRAEDLVRLPIFQETVHMNSRAVGKRVAPDDGFVRRHLHPETIGDQTTGSLELPSVDIGMELEIIRPGSERHNHFLQGRISSTFPDPVDGAFHLARA